MKPSYLNDMLNYKALSKWINAGPATVETELEKMAMADNCYDHSVEAGITRERTKYDRFLEQVQHLDVSQKKTFDTIFLRGYFHQKAGNHSDIAVAQESHFKQSIESYRTFLNSNRKKNTDLCYFAQWQIGVIQQTIGERWPVVEESYLKTIEYDVTRGEALRDILIYRYTQKAWRIAYIYSSYCINQFLDKPPTNRFWHIDCRFYNWKILKYHVPILIAIRKKDEAKLFMDRLNSRAQQYPDDFSQKDILAINDLKNRMEEA